MSRPRCSPPASGLLLSLPRPRCATQRFSRCTIGPIHPMRHLTSIGQPTTHGLLIVLTPDKWPALVNGIGRPELLTDARFADPAKQAANSAQLTAILDQTFASQPMAHWREVFEHAHLTFGVVLGARRSDQGPAAQGERHCRSTRWRRREPNIHDQQPPPGARHCQGSGHDARPSLANTARKSSGNSASMVPRSKVCEPAAQFRRHGDSPHRPKCRNRALPAMISRTEE